MSKPFLSLLTALFVFVSIPSTHAGDWISVGNSPEQPYHPDLPLFYRCNGVVVAGTDGDLNHVNIDTKFESKDFSDGQYRGYYVTKHKSEPLLQDQSFNLYFKPAEIGETVHLDIRLVVEVTRDGRTLSSFARFQAPRSAGKITGRAEIFIPANKNGNNSKSVEFRVECVGG